MKRKSILLSVVLTGSALLSVVSSIAAFAAPPNKPSAATAAPAPAKAPGLPPIKVVAPPPMWAVAYSPDGTHLAVGTYRRVLMFDSTTGAKTGDYLISSDAVRTLAFSDDGKLIAVGTGLPARSGSVILLASDTGQPVRIIKDHDDTIEAMAWEGTDIVTAADDETVGVDDSQTGKALASLTEHIGRCLSVAVPTKTDPALGGDIFATGGADKSVKIWDAKLRRVVVNFDQSTGAVWCLAAGVKPGSFVAGSDDGKVRLFQVRADGARRANAPATEPDPRTGSLVREQTAHQGAVYAVAVSPDGKLIATGGADGVVDIFDNNLYGPNRKLTDAKRDIWGVAISPDSKHIAAASLDGRTRVYDLATGTLVFTVDGKGVVPVAAPAAVPAVGASPRMTMR